MSELIWGANAIGDLIGRNPRSTSRLLRLGAIPAARRIGRRWAVSKRALRELGA